MSRLREVPQARPGDSQSRPFRWPAQRLRDRCSAAATIHAGQHQRRFPVALDLERRLRRPGSGAIPLTTASCVGATPQRGDAGVPREGQVRSWGLLYAKPLAHMSAEMKYAFGLRGLSPHEPAARRIDGHCHPQLPRHLLQPAPNGLRTGLHARRRYGFGDLLLRALAVELEIDMTNDWIGPNDLLVTIDDRLGVASCDRRNCSFDRIEAIAHIPQKVA